MKTIAFGFIFIIIISISVSAQRDCRSAEYEQLQLAANPSIAINLQELANNQLQLRSSVAGNGNTKYTGVIKIPVVVHNLYHSTDQKVSLDQVQAQIDALNRDFRKLNVDAANIPARFAGLAADCQIEFMLATRDIKGGATTGVINKYTAVAEWKMDDKIKYSAQMGDDGWDPNSYLNIWVGNLHKLVGYSSVMGDDIKKDGIVLNLIAFGNNDSGSPYSMGRTAVHEVGHWLGLKHIWGDADCGDDGISDTPQQRSYTTGCPSGIRTTCSNLPDGDMYMNYMDFTNDPCLLMFTNGQKEKMRSMLAPGGYRYSLLSSQGLNEALYSNIPVEDASPKWLKINIYPNPTTTELTIDMAYDERWVGKQFVIVNMTGQVQMQKMIESKIEKIDVSQLKPGIYFIKGDKDGEVMMKKFVKM